MNQWTTDVWRQVLYRDRHMSVAPLSMYRNQDPVSPEAPISSGSYIGIPTSPSVYGRVRSWLLQDHRSAPSELYHGLTIHRKVTTS